MRPSLLLLTCPLLLFFPTPAQTGFFLMAEFVWYNNSLHTYPEIPPGDEGCCYTQRNCSQDCVTLLRYCFKEYQTYNNVSNDMLSGMGCIDHVGRSGDLSKPVEYIDYSQPPRDMKHNRTISTSLGYKGYEDWPGQLQLFVRASVGEYLIEYFQLDFELGLNDPPLNRTINGTFFGSYMTFTFGLSLTCLGHFYGPNCSVYCRPENSSRGHYTCLSDGSKQCLHGYTNTSSDCTTCVPADGCSPDQGYCEAPGECVCINGYTGENCEEVDVCGLTDQCRVSELCVNTGGPQGYSCSPLPSLTVETPSSSNRGVSSVEIAGVVGGSALLLITLCVLALLLILALRRRIQTQTVDLKGGRDEKLPNEDSYSQESALGLMDNPMYDVSLKGTHLPLGKSPSLELGVEYDVDNPLYMLGASNDLTSNGVMTRHEYEYATADEIQPASFVPPVSKEFEMYAEPDFGNGVPPSSSGYSQPRTHHYQEPPLTPPPQQPGPIYDDPLSLPEIKEGAPANLENHYETAEDVLEAANDPQYTIYDSDKEEKEEN